MSRKYSPEEKVHNAAVGKRLRERRACLSVPRSRLAACAGIHETFYRRVEQGVAALTTAQFAKVCLLLDVSADEILGLDKVTIPVPRPSRKRRGSGRPTQRRVC